MSGVLYLVLAVFKMGWIAQCLSRAVVTGFLFGAAIDVVIATRRVDMVATTSTISRNDSDTIVGLAR